MTKPNLRAENATNETFQKILEAGIQAALAVPAETTEVNADSDWRTAAIFVMERLPEFPRSAWVYRGGHHVAIILNQECCGQIVEFNG